MSTLKHYVCRLIFALLLFVFTIQSLPLVDDWGGMTFVPTVQAGDNEGITGGG